MCPRILVLAILFSTTGSLAKPHSTDPIVQWVKKAAKNGEVSPSHALNPGILPLDETEIRIENDKTDIFNKQQIRFSLKPLMGLSNEVDLSKQRKKILELEGSAFTANSLLLAYLDILNLWKLLKLQELLKKSEKFIKKAQRNLPKLKRYQGFDTHSFVSDLAFFVELKTKVNTQIVRLSTQLQKAGNTQLIPEVSSLRFADYDALENVVKKIEGEVDLRLEEEIQKLKHYEFEKKKKESYQVLKFVSVSRENVLLPAETRFLNTEDYSIQLSFRVPFLSDSSELEEAKIDFYEEKNKIKGLKRKKSQEVSELYADFYGLKEKVNVLQLLPKNSFNEQKLAGSMTDLSSALKGETNFLKAKIDFLETHSQIFFCYLSILFYNGKIDENTGNLLTTPPL